MLYKSRKLEREHRFCESRVPTTQGLLYCHTGSNGEVRPTINYIHSFCVGYTPDERVK